MESAISGEFPSSDPVRDLVQLLRSHQDTILCRFNRQDQLLKRLLVAHRIPTGTDVSDAVVEGVADCPQSFRPVLLSGQDMPPDQVQGELPETQVVAKESPSAEENWAIEDEHAPTQRPISPRRDAARKTTFGYKDQEDQLRLEEARAMSLQFSRSVEEPEEVKTCWKISRMKCAKLVQSRQFELATACLIMVNALFMGIEVEVMASNIGKSTPIAFYVADKVFNGIFLIELLVKLFAYGGHFFCREDWNWNIFDFFIVMYSVLEMIYDVLVALIPSLVEGGSASGVDSMRAMRMIRMTRLARVTRITRAMKLLRSLRALINSIVATLRSLGWALLLMVGIMYVFAIVFTQAAAEHQDINGVEPDDSPRRSFYGSLFTSMFTLYAAILGGISWYETVMPLHEISIIYTMLFVGYIFFVSLAVMNVITGVFCSSAIEAAQRDHETMMHNVMTSKAAHLDKIKELFCVMDDDGSGGMTFAELEEKLSQEEVVTFFEALELDVSDVFTFFRLLDEDGGQVVEISEFLDGCLRLRGNAKALDLAKLQHEHSWLMKKQVDFMMFLEQHMADLRKQFNFPPIDSIRPAGRRTLRQSTSSF